MIIHFSTYRSYACKMRKITTILMSAYVFLILVKKNTKVEAYQCVIQGNASNTVLDCSGQNLPLIPGFKQTKILILTDSTVDVLNQISFSNHSDLVSLIMKRTKVRKQQSTTIFEPLKNLRFMIMDKVEMNVDEFVDYSWPKNVEEFTLSNMNITEDHLSLGNQFPKLKRISLKGNKFSFFPKLNQLSPLEEIDADSMNFVMDANDIIPYCKLKTFRANLAFSEIRDVNDYCYCQSVEEWLKRRKIQTNMVKCIANTSLIGEISCQFNFGRWALSKFESCSGYVSSETFPEASISPSLKPVYPKQPYGNKTMNLIFWSLFSSILIILIIAACIVYIRKTRSQMEKENENEEGETLNINEIEV